MLGVVPAIIIVIILGIIFEITGAWMTMFIAGGIGALFVRRHAFVVGFFGVALAWTTIFLYLIVTAQALGVAEVLASLLGMHGMGGAIIAISVLLGGLMGGLGGVLFRSAVELIDGIMAHEDSSSATTTTT